MQLEPERKILFASDIHFDDSDTHAQLNYFLVCPFPCDQTHLENNINVRPHVRTYTDVHSTMKTALQQFKEAFVSLKTKKNLCFELSNGRKLAGDLTFAQLAKKLRKPSVNGILLYIGELSEKQTVLTEIIQDNSSCVDECAVQQILTQSQKQLTKGLKININFHLTNRQLVNQQLVNKQTFTVTIAAEGTDRIEKKVMTELAQKIQQNYGVDIVDGVNDIRFWLELKDGKNTKIPLKSQGPVQQIGGLVNWSNIYIETPPQLKFTKRKIPSQHQLIIYKQNSRNNYIKIPYHEIKTVPLSHLYYNRLAPKDKKKDKNNLICIKVMDILIREDDDFSVLEPYFNIPELKINLVGVVVSQKMYFYKKMQDLIAQTPRTFKLEDYIRSNNKDQDPQVFRTRLRYDIESTAKKTARDVSHIEPIYVYTSETIYPKYVEENGENKAVVYGINKFCRDNSLLGIQPQAIQKDWKCQYISELMVQVMLIPPKQSIVYRGVSHNPRVEIGDIITFKSFTSSSLKEREARNFFREESSDHTLYIMKVRTGKDIIEMSAVRKEAELLLNPFAQFRVVEIDQKKPKLSWMGHMVTQRQIYLQELSEEESPSAYPESIGNVLIWVNRESNLWEGEYIYKQIQLFRHPTILMQFDSTDKLKAWLGQQKTSEVFMDKSARIVMITNMTRYENGLKNPSAGIDAIQQVQKMKSCREVPIFVYMMDALRGAEVMRENGGRVRNGEKIGIGSEEWEVRRFIEENMEVRFEGQEERVEQKDKEEKEGEGKKKIQWVQQLKKDKDKGKEKKEGKAKVESSLKKKQSDITATSASSSASPSTSALRPGAVSPRKPDKSQQNCHLM